MSKWFNIDSPFMQFLAAVGDLIIINVLFLICSLPIITFGPSYCAMYTLVLRGQRKETRGGTIISFFRAFRDNLKNGMALGLIYTVIGVLLFLDYTLLIHPDEGTGLIYTILWGAATFVYIISFSNVFPLQARFTNSVWQQVKNSIIFALIHPVQTISVSALTFVPVYLLLNQLAIFTNTWPFWMLLGFSGIAWVNSLQFTRSFAKLEGENTEKKSNGEESGEE